ncbi:hypothetical protein D3C87_1256110 [compost metagenome]
MHHRAIDGVAEIVRLGTAAPDQFAQVVGVFAVRRAVRDDGAGRAEQGQTGQVRQGFLQLAQQLLLFVGTLRLFDDR